jgi:hypothetical protein
MSKKAKDVEERKRQKKIAAAVAWRMVDHPPILKWENSVTPEEKTAFLRYEASQAVIWHSAGVICLSHDDFREAATRCPTTCVGDSKILEALDLNTRRWCLQKAPYHALNMPHAEKYLGREYQPSVEDCVTHLSMAEIRNASDYVQKRIIQVVGNTSNTTWLQKLLGEGDRMPAIIIQALASRL